MSLTSAFFDAELVGDEYDRVYSAEHFAEYFAAFIANGVFPDPATNLQVVANIPSDMTVLVKPGLGWINGYYCNNDGNYSLTISPASGTLPRVDAVVLRWSRSNRSISLGVKTGTANASPVAPSLERSSDTYELMLASITVAAGATSIAQASITDKRPDSTVCGWVQGTVNQIDTTDLFAQYDNAFQTWFDSIKVQLSGNVATNLQNQINELKTGKVNVSDKATDSEAKAATNDTHWMTPAKVAKSIEANPQFIMGAYTGDSIVINHYTDPTPQFINLGSTPKKVDVFYGTIRGGLSYSTDGVDRTWATSDKPITVTLSNITTNILEIVPGGFKVRSWRYPGNAGFDWEFNTPSVVYKYEAQLY